MDVKIKTEKTYALSMTESQAQNLMNIACMDGEVGTKSELFNSIRQALLDAGLTRTEDPL